MKTKSGIDRISRLIGLENIVDILSKKVSWSDLYTLLLHVVGEKMKTVIPNEVVKNHEKNRLSTVATVDPREFMKIDRGLFDILPSRFLPIELSPIVAAGANTSLTSVSPHIILSTVRNVEVVADPTMVLALECARRRKIDRQKEEIHLATSHRVVRLQAFQPESGFTAHFRAFALASSGKDKGNNALELSSFESHLTLWLDFLAVAKQMGYETSNVSVGISNIRIMESLMANNVVDRTEASRRTQDTTFRPFKKYSVSLPREAMDMGQIINKNEGLRPHLEYLHIVEKRVIRGLRNKYPLVCFYFDLERCAGMGYYSDLCYKLTAENKNGVVYPLADGGASNWTQKLLQNRKEKFFSGGFGSELFCKMFRTDN